MSILLILQCLSKIWLNTVTIILILQEAYGALKRDEVVNNADVTNNNNAPSFKYKASVIGDSKANGVKNGVKIAVPLKYLSNFGDH